MARFDGASTWDALQSTLVSHSDNDDDHDDDGDDDDDDDGDDDGDER